jgi:hypothetical protein
VAILGWHVNAQVLGGHKRQFVGIVVAEAQVKVKMRLSRFDAARRSFFRHSLPSIFASLTTKSHPRRH